MDITLRPMTPEERLYSYTQSSQIGSQTGNIGHLRACYEENGTTFRSTWFDFRERFLKPEDFYMMDGEVHVTRYTPHSQRGAR